ncbi:hypothetical protein G7Y89_g15689 [Cudoniella acicularis]|uniref:Cellobiose dehydrogenase-like cytochrome domain-containing protein n=1 Tax=Cudoniella acicularis TaxID=354080 RepID=A0A8H4VKL9_9HELO|nr:hypothetical protein G7Y89_g15689 [Cudoniella acicularis]
MTPIASGTYVNATHYSYTFLCKACILADGTTFKASDATDTLGFAFSTAAPATPANHASALVHHASDGHFTANIAGAKSAKYDAWAALAVPGQAVTFRA